MVIMVIGVVLEALVVMVAMVVMAARLVASVVTISGRAISWCEPHNRAICQWPFVCHTSILFLFVCG